MVAAPTDTHEPRWEWEHASMLQDRNSGRLLLILATTNHQTALQLATASGLSVAQTLHELVRLAEQGFAAGVATAKTEVGWDLTIVTKPSSQRGFVVQPRRAVAEGMSAVPVPGLACESLGCLRTNAEVSINPVPAGGHLA